MATLVDVLFRVENGSGPVSYCYNRDSTNRIFTQEVV